MVTLKTPDKRIWEARKWGRPPLQKPANLWHLHHEGAPVLLTRKYFFLFRACHLDRRQLVVFLESEVGGRSLRNRTVLSQDRTPVSSAVICLLVMLTRSCCSGYFKDISRSRSFHGQKKEKGENKIDSSCRWTERKAGLNSKLSKRNSAFLLLIWLYFT